MGREPRSCGGADQQRISLTGRAPSCATRTTRLGWAQRNDAAYEKAITSPTAFEGIRATVAHLLVYAVGNGAWTQYDPRYQNVKECWLAGYCANAGGPDGKWAYPGKGYGADIAARANDPH